MIKAFSAGDPNCLAADRYGTDMMMIDGAEPGSGKVFDWSLAGDAPDGLRLILAGGLDAGERGRRDRTRCDRGESTLRRGVERVAGPQGRARGEAVHRERAGPPRRRRTSATTSRCRTTGTIE